MRIITQEDLDAPRELAWSAYDDATYDGDPHSPYGIGSTEVAAIRDLLDQIEDLDGVNE